MSDPEISCQIRYAVVTIQDRDALLGVLREIARRSAARIVCFDAEKMAGRAHAKAALRHANRSFTRGSAISNSFEMEALLYAAGTRQCSAAVAFGLHEGENHLYICCCPTRPGIWDELAGSVHFLDEPDDGISPQKAARLAALFGISPIELDAAGEDRIRDLVLERVALLNVSK